jgi:hypothetical protein
MDDARSKRVQTGLACRCAGGSAGCCWRGSWRRRGRCSTAVGGWLGLGFRFRLGILRCRCVCSCGRRGIACPVCLLGCAFACIVIHVPACTREAQCWRGHRANQRTLAFGAFDLWLGAEILDLFKAVAARGAAIFIEWQGTFLRETLPIFDSSGFVNLGRNWEVGQFGQYRLWLKGTGFSPYIKSFNITGALAPEGQFFQTDPLP